MIVDPDFCDHWKTRMLIGLLGGDQAAPVYVLRLWAHCQNRRQCEFDGITAEALKALCCFPGHANKLESSLAASGFVRRDESRLIVCGWEKYNASLIAAWNNGKKGGRPTQNKPPGSQPETHGLPTGSGVEKKGEEKNKTPVAADAAGGGTKRKAKPDATTVPVPEQLRTPEFLAAWEKWLTHRNEIGHKVMATGAKQTLEQFCEWGQARAIKAIDNTVRKGWQGLREPDPEPKRPLFAGNNGNAKQPQEPVYPKLG